jgi:hypothetical protein
MKMACHRPFIVYERGKKYIIDGQPIVFVKDVLVPCGKCVECKKRKIASWIFRLLQEDKASKTSHFVTLTYDTDNVPLTNSGLPTLDIRDVQLFMKRLRKRQKPKIRYYCCGEYGDKNMRPHYHLIMFDVMDFEDIHKSWDKGISHIGSVSGASAGYTVKYMSKEKKIPMFEGDDRVKEMSLMSKGLGKSYLTDEIKKYHRDDLSRTYCHSDGKKIAMPKYYRDKIYNEEEKREIARLAQESIAEEEQARRAEIARYYRDLAYETYEAERQISDHKKFHKKANQRQNA